MLCDDCKNRAATIHYKEMLYGKIKEYHLCEECAHKRGLTTKKLSPTEVLKKLLQEKNDSDQEVLCPGCYTSLAEFKKSGRFGCSKCLTTLQPYIKDMIKQIHNSERHIGKRLKASPMKGFEGFRLREELKKALGQEAYEEAAQIRDKLKKLGVKNVE